MRIVIQAAAYLLLASLSVGRPSVEVLQVHPSSQNARITVLQNGQRIQNVKVVVLAPDDRPRLSLSTDNRGAVVLPLLPPGTYHVVATASDGLAAELVLEISARKRRKPNSFSMELFLRPPPPPSLQDRIAAAERIAIAEQLQQFNGVVQDQSGAAISRCKIQVFQKGSVVGAPVLEGMSDETGHFSLPLPAGVYTATIQRPGFSTQVQVFEIIKNGGAGGLRIVLQVAPSSE
jgi:hypothetical protein